MMEILFTWRLDLKLFWIYVIILTIDINRSFKVRIFSVIYNVNIYLALVLSREFGHNDLRTYDDRWQ